MLDLFELRRKNLQRLVKERGGTNAVAHMAGYANGSFLSQMIGPNPSREVSEKTARSIETALIIPSGWLDEQHEEGISDDGEQLTLPKALGRIAEELSSRGTKSLSAERFGELCALLFDQCQSLGYVEQTTLKRLIRLAFI